MKDGVQESLSLQCERSGIHVTTCYGISQVYALFFSACGEREGEGD
jgi:hypothetical protein